MPRAVILTGGNTGDMKRRLQQAQQLINEHVGAVLRCSHRYTSAPWGFSAPDAPDFSNQVLEVTTELAPEALLDALQAIERTLGRDRDAERRERERTGQPYASRTIVLDLLFYDDAVIDTPRLRVPHPQIAEREFVLVPLCEILRTKRHPVTGKTPVEMLDELRNRTKNDD